MPFDLDREPGGAGFGAGRAGAGAGAGAGAAGAGGGVTNADIHRELGNVHGRILAKMNAVKIQSAPLRNHAISFSRTAND